MRARRLTSKVMGALCAVVSVIVLSTSPAMAAEAPSVESESVTKLGYSTATLQGEINPKGVEASYRFEYGTTSSYGTTVPTPEGELASGEAAQSVSEQLTTLQPSTTYHYRLVATGAAGTTDGPDQAFTTFAYAQGEQTDACPNATFRDTGLSKNLPDCRAYELVSPVDKNDADIIGQSDTNQASASGNAVAFASRNSFGDTRGSGAAGGNLYVAYRKADEWETHAVYPTMATNISLFLGPIRDRLFSAELDQTVLTSYPLPGVEGGVPEALFNLYLENIFSHHLEVISDPKEGAIVTSPFALGVFALTGGSADLGVLTFQSSANFLPQATGSNEKLYAMNHGKLELAGILPDGSIPAGGSVSARGEGVENVEGTRNDAVSSDGSRIFFMSPVDGSSPPQLYMREDGTRSVLISQSEASSPDPEPHGIKFRGAAPDGNEVVFTSNDRLLDSDPGGPGWGIYLYSNSPYPDVESNLRFIGRFVGSAAPEVLSMSADAKRIYFVTSEERSGGGTPLYVWDEGVTHEITDRMHYIYGNEGDEMRVSSDGERAVFFDKENEGLLTGPRVRTSQVAELYLYEAQTQTLKCVSCPSHGASVVSSVDVQPRATTFGIVVGFGYPHHLMSTDGRYVFFSTPEALVPQDINGLSDVYEYNVETGEVALISSGAGEHGAWFADASASGHDVFFVTSDSYSRVDKDSLVDLYDARVNGGLHEPPPQPVPCAGDACQGTPSAAPNFSTASGFEGLGNPVHNQAAARTKKATKKTIKPKKPHAKKRKKISSKKRNGSGKRASSRSRR